MSRSGLALIWSILGTLLSLYSFGTWAILQGGKSLAELPGLDGRAPVTSAYEAIIIIGTLLGILSAIGIQYMRQATSSDEASLPLVAIANVGPHNMNSFSMRTYQSFFFFVFLLLPAVSLYQLNAAVFQRGVLWHDGDAALGGIALKNAFTWTTGGSDQDKKENACRKEVTRDDGFVWLANMRCDLVKANRLKPFTNNGKSIKEDAEGHPSTCTRELATTRVSSDKCENAIDVSEICESSERRCRGMQWLPILSPTMQIVATMFGWMLFGWLIVEALRRNYITATLPRNDVT